MTTNRQRIFIDTYKEITCKAEYEDLLSEFKADLEYDKRIGKWEVYIPSTNPRTQAVMFYLEGEELCGYERSD